MEHSDLDIESNAGLDPLDIEPAAPLDPGGVWQSVEVMMMLD